MIAGIGGIRRSIKQNKELCQISAGKSGNQIRQFPLPSPRFGSRVFYFASRFSKIVL